MSGWPTSQSTPLAPKTTAQLESKTVTERVAREHKGEPNIGFIGLPATPQLDPMTGQRLSEEYGGDLDTVLMVADTLRPEGRLQIRGETMPGDRLVRVDNICCAYPEMQATKDLVLGENGSKADLHSPGDKVAATVLRHATMTAAHLIMEGIPSPTPALQTCGTHWGAMGRSRFPLRRSILGRSRFPLRRSILQVM